MPGSSSARPCCAATGATWRGPRPAGQRQVLEHDRLKDFSIVSPGIHGHLTRRKLAALAERRGEMFEAMRFWNEVLAECPDDPEASRARVRLARPSYTVVTSVGRA